MRELFVNAEDRLRAGWRLLFQYLLNDAGISLLGFVVLSAAALSGGGGGTPPPYLLYTGAALVAAASVWFCGRSLDGRPFSGFGLRLDRAWWSDLGFGHLLYTGAALVAAASVWFCGRSLDGRLFSGFGLRLDRAWWSDLGFGLVLGASLMTGIFLLQLAAGWVTVTGSFVTAGGGAFFPAILTPVVLFVCVGFYEELVSRGYQLTNLAEGLNGVGVGPGGAIVLAWILSSSLFAFLHLSNPNASALGTLNIFLAGMMLGTGYVLTGQLAIPIGLHVTWNLFQGNVFGFPVSGLDITGATLIATRQAGPALLTGGPFGPEAGLIAPAAMAVGVGLIALRVRRRTGKLGLHLPLAESPSVRR